MFRRLPSCLRNVGHTCCTEAQVRGFTFLAVVILLFSGVQLCVLGIIGEYLSRVYLRLLGKPAFVIKEML